MIKTQSQNKEIRQIIKVWYKAGDKVWEVWGKVWRKVMGKVGDKVWRKLFR
jgi:hypothetical protein